MAADIFGQRIERDIGAVLDRPLEHRAEQRVVAGDDRRVALRLADLSATRRISAMSTRLLVGLAGVSIKIIETRPLRIASSAAA